jgi:hypothetical protein
MNIALYKLRPYSEDHCFKVIVKRSVSPIESGMIEKFDDFLRKGVKSSFITESVSIKDPGFIDNDLDLLKRFTE